MEISIPKKAEYIIDELTDNGFEAFAVGGCVRDIMLGREPKDWDITTSASPAEVKNIFKRTVDTGIAHGTVTVMLDKEGFEVTTYRIDGEYEDSRHPKEVKFTTSLTEDLKRRDFTINAMAYNPKTGLVDEFGGMEDLKNKVIRCVGNANERFSEDALRILRAVRFSAQLGFSIDKETRAAARELAPTLKNISRERIQSELDKLLKSQNPDYIIELDRLSLMENIFEEKIIIDEHTLNMLSSVRNDRMLRWTAFLQGKSFEQAKGILRGLKFDNYTINTVGRLIKWLRVGIGGNRTAVRKAVNQIGVDIFALLLEAQKAFCADASGSGEENIAVADNVSVSGIGSIGSFSRMDGDYNEIGVCLNLETVNEAEKIYNDIMEKGECVSLKQLAVSGNDILKGGYAEGKKIGEMLDCLLEIVLCDPTQNDRDILLKKAEDMQRKVAKNQAIVYNC